MVNNDGLRPAHIGVYKFYHFQDNLRNILLSQSKWRLLWIAIMKNKEKSQKFTNIVIYSEKLLR